MRQTFNTLTDAIDLAEYAHRKQVDKAGLPYINHPRRVLAKVQAQGALPYVQMAAILHDVTEDTKFTPEMLLGLGFPESAVRIVRLLDRDESEVEWAVRGGAIGFVVGSNEYKAARDAFYYKEIRKDAGAKLVKLDDIADNLLWWRLVSLEKATQHRLQEKYAKALALLGE